MCYVGWLRWSSLCLHVYVQLISRLNGAAQFRSLFLKPIVEGELLSNSLLRIIVLRKPVVSMWLIRIDLVQTSCQYKEHNIPPWFAASVEPRTAFLHWLWKLKIYNRELLFKIILLQLKYVMLKMRLFVGKITYVLRPSTLYKTSPPPTTEKISMRGGLLCVVYSFVLLLNLR